LSPAILVGVLAVLVIVLIALMTVRSVRGSQSRRPGAGSSRGMTPAAWIVIGLIAIAAAVVFIVFQR
jgi:hypothetical protein